MGLLSFLTGKSETAEKVVDGAISGIDAAFYTKEEKAQAHQKVLDWKPKLSSLETILKHAWQWHQHHFGKTE